VLNAMHTAADDTVGQIVAALKEAKRWSRTILFVTSDK